MMTNDGPHDVTAFARKIELETSVTSTKQKTAEAALVEMLKSKEPMSKERGLEVLATMIRAGRVGAPTSGGPPPRVKSSEEPIEPDPSLCSG